jgi:hypothetical protein
VGIDPLKDVFHVSDKERSALEAASSIVGSIWSVWGAVNSAKSVLTELGVLPQADQVQAMRHYIDQLVQDFHGVVAALDTEQSMRAVADQLAMARTQHLHLSELAPEDASGSGDPTWDGLRPIVLNDSLQAVITLGEPAYWQRVFFPELVYQKWPPGETHPVPVVSRNLGGLPSGLVYDYRLIMPAYVEAVAIRLTILVAVVKNYHRVAVPELTMMVATLESHFQRIRASISEVMWVPSHVHDSSENPTGGMESWVDAGALVGAVEIYSACDRVAPWPTNEFPRANFSNDAAEWRKFLVRYAVRNWVRWKQLYDDIGLNAVAKTIVMLKRMAGIEPGTLPDPEVHRNDQSYTGRKIRGGEYSLKELALMLHDISAQQWGRWNILDDEHGKMANPLSLKAMLGALQTFRATPYTSFREALQQ